MTKTTTPAPVTAGIPLLLQPEAVLPALEAALPATGDDRSLRGAVVQFLQEARAAATPWIEADFTGHPRNGRDTITHYATMTDSIVQAVFHVATTRLPLAEKPGKGDRLAVLAVGGYGRSEMAPYSDVDLLFLTQRKIPAWAEGVIQAMLYMLWDLKLKVGHSSRTIEDCLKLAKEDVTIRTALLEQRYIVGNEPLSVQLNEKLRRDLFRTTGPEFIEAKLAERAERHKRQGGQRYVLEPNVKEGKGGLRDLQTLYWIAKYIHGVNKAAELVPLGVFTREEYDRFRSAEDYLWAVRCHLHLIAGRAVDQLTFDMQVEVARRMGYADSAGRRAVEVFMQDYFRHATVVGEVTRIFLTSLESRHVKRAPLVRMLRRRKPLKPPFVDDNGRINISDTKAFLADPLNMLRIFEEALRTGLLIHPDAMRILSAHLDIIDDEMRNNREAARIFLGLLLKHGNPERPLRRMNELGILSAFIPEFEPIVAMMQFNMYHSYTVDEHTLQVISTAAQLERGELTEELPLTSKILSAGVNRKVLYVTLLLHDIGKGRPEDHSILGAQIARKVCPRLGLTAEETETVEWLIRHHLQMSDVAQKRDLSDPATIREFAKQMKTRKRLDLLTILTVCDIRGVGPSVWNNWKASLLRRLYTETSRALEHGLEALNREQRTDEARRALRERLADWEPRELRSELARHYPPYWQGLSTEAHATFANLLRGLGPDEIRIDLHPDPDHDATRAAFVLADHPGIFSRLAGALALVGANVVDARTYTSKDGYATAIFWIQDAEGHPFEEDRLPRLLRMIDRTLAGEVVARDALKDRDKVKKRESQFRFPTHITFDNDGSELYTIIEVDTRDRPGLLYDLTRALAAQNIYIASAMIATYGAQVVDSFYVKDMFGLKLGKTKEETLERKLREAISRGAERAAQP
ncbi:[protein-PII] uridylyltransferase [Sinirhodobacter populi]|uniref:Bifunctional uridylyltransferase/uridylyl-removing enzyme n=1 Tax=Paenirhodobacter populi TaxID=2306993 RepID=A0A443KFD1_9RHOB|nr:[protein-PII] uridylyltransferase [Sinirhodobacter populi]RWR31423.1 [protein-PII] uridylyltransferase [Sinirhodobacter populi]